MMKRVVFFCLFVFLQAPLVSQKTDTLFIEDVYQRFGFTLKQSFLSKENVSRFHPIDVYNDGLYSLFEFHTPHLTIYNSMFATTDSLEALKGGQKKVKGIWGYTHQAFLDFQFSIASPARLKSFLPVVPTGQTGGQVGRNDRIGDDFLFNILVGRDFVTIDYGKGGSLLIDRESRPFDQVKVKVQYRRFTGEFAQIQLDKMGTTRRYLSYHSLRWDYGDRFSVMAAEALLYSGEGRSVEYPFFNPVLFWTPVMVNDDQMLGNGLLYAGLSWKPITTWEIWLEGLIDDYQVNRRSQGDLEPNELGFTGGVAFSGKPWHSSDGWLEYTRITNRTYQTADPTEAYLHRGFPIGHYLGNDFDQWQLHYENQVKMPSQLREIGVFDMTYYLNLSYIRDGANGLDTPWDEPWMDSTITLETGYSEPFPTQPVTYVTEVESGIEIPLKKESFISLGLFWQRKELDGKVDTQAQLVFRLWIGVDKVFHY